MERRDLLKGIAAGLSALGFKEATAADPVARESFVLEPGQEIPVVIKLGDATYSFTAKLSAIAVEARADDKRQTRTEIAATPGLPLVNFTLSAGGLAVCQKPEPIKNRTGDKAAR